MDYNIDELTIYTTNSTDNRTKSKFFEIRLRYTKPINKKYKDIGSKRLGKVSEDGVIVQPNYTRTSNKTVDLIMEEVFEGTGINPYQVILSRGEVKAQPFKDFITSVLVEKVNEKLEKEANTTNEEVKEESPVESESENNNLVEKEITIDDIFAKRYNDYVINLFEHITESICLKEILVNSFGKTSADRILTVAYFLVMEQKAIRNIEMFQKFHDLPARFSADTCGRLFSQIGEDEKGIHMFFSSMAALTNNSRSIGADTTTFGTYSSKLAKATKGFNKDKDGLDTVKVLLLHSIEHNLPIAFSLQHGNIPDVISFHNTIMKAKSIGLPFVEFVSDRGFNSQQNINEVIEEGMDITGAVNISNKYVKEHLYAPYGDYNTLLEALEAQPIKTGRRPSGIRIETEVVFKTNKGPSKPRKVFLNYYINHDKYSKNSADSMSTAVKIADKVLYGYCQVTELTTSEYMTIKPFYDIVENNKTGLMELKETPMKTSQLGLFCLLSTIDRSPQETLEVYEKRGLVEIAFRIMKNNLDGKRARTGNIVKVIGKNVCIMVALIIKSVFQEVLNRMDNKCLNVMVNHTIAKSNRRAYDVLRLWLADNSMHNILQWFDSFDSFTVHRGKETYDWDSETIARDKLFLQLFSGCTKEYAATLNKEALMKFLNSPRSEPTL